MNIKQQLPDELLDMISGGVLTIGGEEVGTVIFNGPKGIILYTDSGAYEMEYSTELQAMLKADPALFKAVTSEISKDISAMKASEVTFKFEDYIAE